MKWACRSWLHRSISNVNSVFLFIQFSIRLTMRPWMSTVVVSTGPNSENRRPKMTVKHFKSCVSFDANSIILIVKHILVYISSFYSIWKDVLLFNPLFVFFQEVLMKFNTFDFFQFAILKIRNGTQHYQNQFFVSFRPVKRIWKMSFIPIPLMWLMKKLKKIEMVNLRSAWEIAGWTEKHLP